MMANAFNTNTRETETGGSLWVQGQPDLQSKFHHRLQSYTEKPISKNQNKKRKKIKAICHHIIDIS